MSRICKKAIYRFPHVMQSYGNIFNSYISAYFITITVEMIAFRFQLLLKETELCINYKAEYSTAQWSTGIINIQYNYSTQ